jgi:hypothetical protein
VLPKKEGGTLNAGNATFACFECNQNKGDLLIRDWLILLKAADDFRAPIVERFINRNTLLVGPHRIAAE